ncbi:hypothetical protein [Virgibacillus pantothenticus]|nr:hypothetical protein [Virgibacillus pantothenticus]
MRNFRIAVVLAILFIYPRVHSGNIIAPHYLTSGNIFHMQPGEVIM